MIRYKTINKDTVIAKRKCACGCGGDVLITTKDLYPARIKRDGGIKKFINNHHFKTKEVKENIIKANKNRINPLPEPAQCINRRLRGKQYFSRHLMEQALGRKLSSNELVHHIDGDQTNDTIDNLTIVSRSEHTTIHNNERGKKDLLDKNIEKIKNLYNQGMTQRDIAKQFGVCQVTICNFMKRYKIKARVTSSKIMAI